MKISQMDALTLTYIFIIVVIFLFWMMPDGKVITMTKSFVSIGSIFPLRKLFQAVITVYNSTNKHFFMKNTTFESLGLKGLTA